MDYKEIKRSEVFNKLYMSEKLRFPCELWYEIFQYISKEDLINLYIYDEKHVRKLFKHIKTKKLFKLLKRQNQFIQDLFGNSLNLHEHKKKLILKNHYSKKKYSFGILSMGTSDGDCLLPKPDYEKRKEENKWLKKRHQWQNKF